MTTLLHFDASIRADRSLSRRLSKAFVDGWLTQRPDTKVLRRDLAEAAPPFIDTDWIAAAFTAPGDRSPSMRAKLAISDAWIAELEAADVLVIGTPMYNYGMPARLKAWVDQVIRVNRTFSFDLARGDWPLEPVLCGKTMVLLTSCGEFGFEPGGPRADMNHLDTHLRVVGRYLGVEHFEHIGIAYQEFGDERHHRSVENALAAVPRLVHGLVAAPRRSHAPH